MPSIFVNLCSYRDPLLITTLRNMMENESGNNYVIYGIFEQRNFEFSLENKFPEIVNHPRVRYKRIDSKYSEGIGWARHTCSLMCENEDFYYQTDSHMLFDPNWDQYLIDDYELGKSVYSDEKIIIAGSAKAFDISPDNGKPRILQPEKRLTSEANFFGISPDGVPWFHGCWCPPKEHLTEAKHLFGGNIFTHSDFLNIVGINPRTSFFGEEAIIMLSAFKSEYKILHPRELHCYHLIDTVNYYTKSWTDPTVSNEKTEHIKNRGLEEFKRFIDSQDKELFEKYRKYSGFDYINKKIEKRSWTDLIVRGGDKYQWLIEDRSD